MATIQELQQHVVASIKQAFPEPEAGSIALLVLEHVLQKGRMQLRMSQQEQVQPAQEESVKQAIKRLQRQEPVQYVLGTAHFYGLDLHVNEHVLIPRPETEELVDRVLKTYQGQEGLHVLDICAGSGCIPLVLQANLPTANVWGLEVSEGALEVARINAAKYKLPVTWLQADICAPVPASIAAVGFDIITSNPPYVLEEEKEQMRENVLQYEPHLALFVPDTDPLKFYRRILGVALQLLKKGGRLYFEINERYSEQVQELLQQAGYEQPQVGYDLYGKARFVTATR